MTSFHTSVILSPIGTASCYRACFSLDTAPWSAAIDIATLRQDPTLVARFFPAPSLSNKIWSASDLVDRHRGPPSLLARAASYRSLPFSPPRFLRGRVLQLMPCTVLCTTACEDDGAGGAVPRRATGAGGTEARGATGAGGPVARRSTGAAGSAARGRTGAEGTVARRATGAGGTAARRSTGAEGTAVR